MGYRIHFGLVSRKELNYHLSRDWASVPIDDVWDKKIEYFHDKCEIELMDTLELNQFKIAKGFVGEEYPVHIIEKADFLKILQFYQKELCKGFLKKHEGLSKNDSKENHWASIAYHMLDRTMRSWIDEGILIDDSNVFLIQYFYLVRIYENWRSYQVGVIQHG